MRADAHRRKDARDGGACQDGSDRLATRYQDRPAGGDLGGDDVQRDLCILQPSEGKVPPDEVCQTIRRHEVGTPTEKPKQTCQRMDWEMSRRPIDCQLSASASTPAASGEPCSVDRTDGTADDEVREHTALDEATEHPNLHRAEAGPTREDERSWHQAEHTVMATHPASVG